MSTERSDKTKLAVISNDISYIKDDIRDIKSKLNAKYITRTEFEPIKKIVYGVVAIILTAVVGAIVGLVILK